MYLIAKERKAKAIINNVVHSVVLIGMHSISLSPVYSCIAFLPSFYDTSILKTFKSCVDEGKKCTAPQWLRKLKKGWWSKVVPYFLLASSCGSLDVVKYFIESGQKPNIRYLYNEIVHCDCMNHVQWNLSIKDTYRATANILNIYFSCTSILHFWVLFKCP